MPLLKSLIFLFFIGSGILSAKDLISSISELRMLSELEAREQIPVELEGQIIEMSANYDGAFVNDDGQGVHFAFRSTVLKDVGAKVGSVIRVKGHSWSGTFLPGVQVQEVVVVGERPIPEPRKIEGREFNDPRLDCQWVTFSGIVTKLDLLPQEQSYYMEVTCHGEPFVVRITRQNAKQLLMEDIKHRPVTVRAVAVTESNKNRQFVNRSFLVPRASDLIFPDFPDPPLLPISRLLRKDSPPSQLVRVEGVVLHQEKNILYLRGEDACLRVTLAKESEWARGDVLEATGHAEPGSYSPILFATKVSHIRAGDIPEPRPLVIPEKTFDASYHGELVTLDAILKRIRILDGETILQCDLGDRISEVHLPGSEALPPGVEIGAGLRLCGICELFSDNLVVGAYSRPNQFQLRLRDFSDLEVINPAPWWNPRYLLIGLGLVALIAALVAAWGFLLRSKVREQTELITLQVEEKTILQERQRIARELHDTLQQHLTGVGLQLEHVQKKFTEDTDAKGPLQLAQSMVDHCRREARDSIVELRETPSAAVSLADQLDELLLEEVRIGSTKLQIETRGEARPLSNFQSRHILRISQEAVRNALHHARADLISLIFDYSSESFTVTIQDDGVGFNLEEQASGTHFGIVGMRERANRLGAELRVESHSGSGTYVTLIIPEESPND